VSGPETPSTSALRADVVRVLERWAAPDGDRERLRGRYLAHVAAVDDPLHRGGDPVHLTASCAVLSADLRFTLLVEHRRAGRWLQPGGHLEATDARLRAAALREATEETGVAGLSVTDRPVDLHAHRLGAAFGRCREHLDVRYAAVAPAGAAATPSPESRAVAWWPVDRLPRDAVDDLGPLLEAALRSAEERRLPGR
jgi:8-oxo-dGTP pyrophosphatase MutT (NUDIX family)